MRYYGEEALGMIETIGMVPALDGCDKMLKAADVELISYENIGSTLVTILVKGDVAACRASVAAGKARAEAIGTLTAANVIPRPIRAVGDIVSCHDVEQAIQPDPATTVYTALGLVETFGLVFVLAAADAMVKTGDVELIGYENTASGYISVLVAGDVAACQSAVDAGCKAVEDLDGKLYSHTVIANPHHDIYKIIERYSLDKLLG